MPKQKFECDSAWPRRDITGTCVWKSGATSRTEAWPLRERGMAARAHLEQVEGHDQGRGWWMVVVVDWRSSSAVVGVERPKKVLLVGAGLAASLQLTPTH
jgi:hypothetical protein